MSGEVAGVVGRAGEEDGRVLGAFGDEDDGVEFYAVAHGDHDLAAGVVEGVGDGLDLGGGFAGESGGRLGVSEGQEAKSGGHD